MRTPTASEMQRAVACSASVVLPLLPRTEQSASALRGSRIHAYVAARLLHRPLPSIGKTQVKHIRLGQLRRYLSHGKLRCELAMAYNGFRAEVVGEDIGRDYNRPGELCGSADIVVERPHAMVVDIKTGSFPVPHPVENWQLATLAMMYALSHPECLSVTGVIATLARDGSWGFGEPHAWTLDELAVIRARVDEARLRWHDADEMYRAGFGVDESPGRDCMFCKARCQYNAKAQESEAA